MIRKLLQYYYLRLRWPQAYDFLDMGFGIEARYQRCRKFWSHHLSNCIAFQKRHLADESRPTLAILGAGRLYDVDLAALSRMYSAISLYDADPSCRAHWARCSSLSPSLSFNIVDLTGCLESWTSSFKQFLRSSSRINEASLSSFLSALRPPDPPDLSCSACLSLNLLSQIPIYWRDRTQRLLKQYWRYDTDEHGNYSRSVQQALESSMRALQEQHLKLLSQTRAARIVMLFDSKFLYYRSNSSQWQSERSLFITPPILPGYEISESASWLWDIAPQGVEQKEYGIAHEVQALSFNRLST